MVVKTKNNDLYRAIVKFFGKEVINKKASGVNTAKNFENSLNAIGAVYTSNYWEAKTQISKYHTKGGHGFAAEDANTLVDKLLGRDAKVIGTNYEKNGADRIVDGVKIQTKYFKTPQQTINSAFDPETGLYRYTGQKLEVPADQYEECVKLMEQKICEGKVPGVKDPAKAKELVKKGHLTYKQAVNIAKAGTVESIIYDATNQAVVCTHALGLSFVTSFAIAIWRGVDFKNAVKVAAAQTVKVVGQTFVAGVITSQLLRTKLAAKGTVLARHGVKVIAKTEIGKKAIEQIAKASLGKSIHGVAAINHVSKLLRTNIITATITTIITTGPDFYKALIEESITWEQLFKNLFVNAASIGGGIMGAETGAAIGTAICPVIGTVIGGVIGGLLGGFLAQSTVKAVADEFIEDDIEKMQRILKEVFADLGKDYLLSEEEFKQVIEKFKEKLQKEKNWFGRMVRNYRRKGYIGAYQYAYNYCSKICDEVVRKRKYIRVPDAADIVLILET